MTFFLDRTVHGKSWRFILTVPHTFWTDLFNWNWPGMPQRTARDAYQHDQPFWDHLAEWNAHELGKGATPESARRTREATPQHREWLIEECRRFKQAAKTS